MILLSSQWPTRPSLFSLFLLKCSTTPHKSPSASAATFRASSDKDESLTGGLRGIAYGILRGQEDQHGATLIKTKHRLQQGSKSPNPTLLCPATSVTRQVSLPQVLEWKKKICIKSPPCPETCQSQCSQWQLGKIQHVNLQQLLFQIIESVSCYITVAGTQLSFLHPEDHTRLLPVC